MSRRISVEEYLAGEETMRPHELDYGLLREPPAPGFHHQIVVGRIHHQLDAHVRRFDEGRVALSPVDVILDRGRALVVQPDLVFISASRLAICSDRIQGPPDLVVEVLSSTNRHHDRVVKVGWYQTYGVRECGMVDPNACRIDVIDLTASADDVRVYSEGQILRSRVLPRLRLRPGSVCED